MALSAEQKQLIMQYLKSSLKNYEFIKEVTIKH